jgi:kynurenine formamidase
MQLIDLSIEVAEGPNEMHPKHAWLTYAPIATHETGVFESNCVEMFLHAGSHIDAPYHFDANGARIHDVPLKQVVGPAIVLDVSDVAPGERVDVSRLADAKDRALKEGAEYEPGMIALVRTDWSKRAAPPAKAWFDDGPYLDTSAARWLIEEKFASVGFDFPQDKVSGDLGRLMSLKSGETKLEELDDPPLPVHVLLLGNGVCQIENIANLDQLPKKRIIVVAAPILLRGAEGAPARVFAIIE